MLVTRCATTGCGWVRQEIDDDGVHVRTHQNIWNISQNHSALYHHDVQIGWEEES